MRPRCRPSSPRRSRCAWSTRRACAPTTSPPPPKARGRTSTAGRVRAPRSGPAAIAAAHCRSRPSRASRWPGDGRAASSSSATPTSRPTCTWACSATATCCSPRPSWSLAPPLAVPTATVARGELVEGERRLTAVRGERGWTDATGRPWSQGPVSDLLAALGALRPLATVDPDPAAPGDHGLGPGGRRLELAAADGRPLLALELGERNPAWTGLYARRAGEPAVLLVGG